MLVLKAVANLQVAEPTGYGAHGILRDGDSNAKRAEFQAWAIDTKNVDIETLMKVSIFDSVPFPYHPFFCSHGRTRPSAF